MDASNACPGQPRCGVRRFCVCLLALLAGWAAPPAHAAPASSTIVGPSSARVTSVQPAPDAPDARSGGEAGRERSTPLGTSQGGGRSGSGQSGSVPAGDSAGASPLGGVLDLAVPMAVVLGAIFGAAWLFRRVMGAGSSLASALGAGGRAPSGVIEVLGRYPVARGQMLVLIKLDRRILLLGHSAPTRSGGVGGGFSTLSEITEPEEVASILTRVEEGTGESFAARYEQLLRGDADPPGRDGVEVVPTAQAPARRAHRSRDGDAVELWDTAGSSSSARSPSRAQGTSEGEDGETSLRERLLKLRAGSAGIRAG